MNKSSGCEKMAYNILNVSILSGRYGKVSFQGESPRARMTPLLSLWVQKGQDGQPEDQVFVQGSLVHQLAGEPDFPLWIFEHSSVRDSLVDDLSTS